MKTACATVALALTAGSASAFVAPSAVRGCNVVMSAAPEGRRAFASKAAVALIGLTTFSQGASAAKYFGDKNDYPEVLKPENAIKDDAVFGSKETKTAVGELQAYKKAVTDLQAALAKDPQADLKKQIKSTFEYSQLRNSLNQAGSAFDEDSQRGLDRISRLILQYTIEFEEASKLKPNVPRNARRLSAMTTKLNKLSSAFDDMLKFF